VRGADHAQGAAEEVISALDAGDDDALDVVLLGDEEKKRRM